MYRKKLNTQRGKIIIIFFRIKFALLELYCKYMKCFKGRLFIIFVSNVFHNSHLIQKCIQKQQQLLILYTFLNQMRVVKNIRRKDDRMNSLQYCQAKNLNSFVCFLKNRWLEKTITTFSGLYNKVYKVYLILVHIV